MPNCFSFNLSRFVVAKSLMCAELIGNFYLGDSKQPTCKSPLRFDLVL